MVDKIRKEHEVQIQVPSPTGNGGGGGEVSNIITVTGYESNCYAAKEEILKLVKELVSNLALIMNFVDERMLLREE